MSTPASGVLRKRAVAGGHARAELSERVERHRRRREHEPARPALYAGSVYEVGPLHATTAYERYKDFQPLNALLGAPASSGTDGGWNLVALSYG